MARFNVYCNVEKDTITSGLYDYAVFTRKQIRDYLKDACLDLKIYMKNNRPWNDRTGEARRNLSAEYYEEGGALQKMPKTLGINLSHGVEYGVFLEYNGEFNKLYLPRRRPILVPTLEREVPKVFKGMEGLLDKLSW